MRFMRAGLSFALLILGKDVVQPATIVHFIQTRRRKLRAIKYQGLKTIRSRSNHHEQKNASWFGRIPGVFGKMMCTANTVTDDAVRVVVGGGGKNNKSSIGVEQQSSSKRRHDDGEESEENDEAKLKFTELLDKYVNEDSDDDSNFEVIYTEWF